MKTTRVLAAAALAAISLGMAGCGGSDDDDEPTVEVLSAKPHQVTGGNALIAIRPAEPGGTLRARLNGVDVSTAFQPDPTDTGRVVGLVSGLTDGANTFVADYGGDSESITLTNYPITGPVISGPHQTPFICQTEAFILPDGSNLGPALDANCSVATRVHYLYLASGATTLTPMANTTAVPADAASTTTLAGVTVPFIVRVETGTVDRGIYQTAVLHNPVTNTAPSPTQPAAGVEPTPDRRRGLRLSRRLVYPGRGAGQPHARRIRVLAAQPQAPRRGLRDLRQHAAPRFQQLQRGAGRARRR